jgi:ABC-type transport system involved in multi-copper enzyme maturation permease subunit
MAVDLNDVVPFLDWLRGGVLTWLAVVACVTAGVTAFGWLVAAVRHGPVRATQITWQILRSAAIDLTHISPRRVWALARLAIQESIRRRVVVVFAVFILILLFAGWFLDPGSVDPARLYIGFVLTATSYLVLLLALFLSSLSLPTDIKNRTLHTVVTKPVRASEVVLGRIVGFTAVATILLLVMGAISYVFVVRGLAHTHQLTAADLQPVEGTMAGHPAGLQGATSRVHQHRHEVVIGSSDHGHVKMEQGHTHAWTAKKQGDKVVYEIGPAEGMLVARVPVYGKLAFLDRTGKPAEKGISVGDEWTYRSFIDGGTLATAIWTFQGITPERFPNGLPVAMTLAVFRTYKGDIEKGVLGSLAVRNPTTGKKVEVKLFRSKEYVIDEHDIPREFRTPKGEKVDLFKDIVSDGRVEVCLQCADPMQNFGVAQADLYLRARNASFGWNFVKGYLGIWLQTVLVIVLGVMFSTFLSGPVAMLATLGTLVGGFFNDFMLRLATGHTYGGGPFESIIRILTQQNVTSEPEASLRSTVAQALDQVAERGLWVLANILPDFGKFSFSDFVASGFNVPGDTVLIYTCRAFGFVLPVFVAAYLCLKNREVAQQ